MEFERVVYSLSALRARSREKGGNRKSRGIAVVDRLFLFFPPEKGKRGRESSALKEGEVAAPPSLPFVANG